MGNVVERSQDRIRRQRARQSLARLLSGKGSFDLVEAALWIAYEEYDDLDVEREAGRLRILAAEGARRVVGMENPFARLDGVQRYFADDLGFHGNAGDYDDPRNSYLNEVLDRRVGIPLTLSLVFMELARAAGFETIGVGLPGHFVARVTYGERTILVDPYHGAQVISEEDCRQLVRRCTGRSSLFRRELLRGVPEWAMLRRLLLNLKHTHVSRNDYARALSIVERLILLQPADSKEIRDMGFLKAHLGRPGAAIVDLETYLSLDPGAPDRESVQGRLVWLRRKLSETN
jgi:regulator of sirC expression with transglutaminase-like and TPR domain